MNREVRIKNLFLHGYELLPKINRMKGIFTICVVLATSGLNFAQKVEAGKSINGSCKEGFRYQENFGCTDIDECAELAPCKIGQSCRNLWGSYICICPHGYKYDAATGLCEDKNECEMGYCGNGEKCINTVGSFRCLCSPGTTKIGRFCRDINECTQSPCEDNQYCINTRGSYMCRCKMGFTHILDNICEDTDECTQGMCRGAGEECRNTVGSYECVCRAGYGKDPSTNGRYCTDIDECKQNFCPSNSECINTQGSYFCRCHRGFSKLSGLCVDNQECSLGEGSKCQWRCINTPGSFECECPDGYNRNDYACIDKNECDGQKMCRRGETCVNIHGGYRCIEALTCPKSGFYRKLMTTDEFGYRQVTTNICRRKRCRRITSNNTAYAECRSQPLSVSFHYVDVTSGLQTPTNLLKISFPARRRRQEYHFSIPQGDMSLFNLHQPSRYRPMAYLRLNKEVTGPAEYAVKVDMSTYDKRGNMRDNRMLTITVIVSEYDF
ncbi:unnamed protein product [Clavelina lepadiformis]|uniref:EGF-like domain-containing protein n=2 Tax=Clavelina lepadiformis TaxID=159417 RepID=A0ABP0FI10_CLALP